MDSLVQFGIFFGKTLIIFLFIVALMVIIAAIAARAKARPQVEIEDLNEKFADLSLILRSVIRSKKVFKSEQKKLAHDEKKLDENRKNVFVLDFDGDLQANAVKELRDEVSSVVAVARPDDEVVVCVESPGGTVSGYGLAAAELVRLRKANLKVTVCVDKVAASGGYMMACTGHRIIAAPFAVVGSIGVLAQVPNFNKLLKEHKVEYEEMTSGEFKRTISFLGEITPKGRQKFQEQLEDTHELFKNWVAEYRPQLDMSKVGTGEYWYGPRAQELNLIDDIQTSDEYLMTLTKTAKVFKVKFTPRKKLSEKLSEALGTAGLKVFDRLLQRVLTRYP
jgi:serine protease SohB